ncbi:MAG TPA: UDP-glucuronosyltransferase [Cerasibacillus sp.]|uniref:MGDG synthase family glycosyltransferase n=1 Tax=Cerasibacillus sp. TaxID=2498711 RepID=UPI002F42D113
MSTEKRVLFLPFMRIASGHHQVANALLAMLKQIQCSTQCEKVDILSYSYGNLESVISEIYLAWIKYLPHSYHWLYVRSSVQTNRKEKQNTLYGTFFLPFFKKMLREKQPDILFCTHALPSNIANRLKQKGNCHAIIVNAYTDFFINRVWGLSEVDFHFVPSQMVKDELLRKGVSQDKIFVTGILVHPAFRQGRAPLIQRKKQIKMLVSGGNLGINMVDHLFKYNGDKLHFYILCGKNNALYQKLKNENHSHITPISYISSPQKMSLLYDQVDAVLTKPGGVTISECLHKKKPIFVYHVLPGQEKINEQQLLKLGLIMPINLDDNQFEEQIINYFNDQQAQKNYLSHVEKYLASLKQPPLSLLF